MSWNLMQQTRMTRLIHQALIGILSIAISVFWKSIIASLCPFHPVSQFHTPSVISVFLFSFYSMISVHFFPHSQHPSLSLSLMLASDFSPLWILRVSFPSSRLRSYVYSPPLFVLSARWWWMGPMDEWAVRGAEMRTGLGGEKVRVRGGCVCGRAT